MSEKVLIVDDERDFLEALSERMSTRGVIVQTATSAVEALKKTGEQSYDAVILDLRMPEMDGLETLKAMKQKNPELQIILLTGHGSIDKGIEAMKLGAMDFIEKPADLKVLMKKIKQAKAKKMVIVEQQMEEKIKNIINVKGW